MEIRLSRVTGDLLQYCQYQARLWERLSISKLSNSYLHSTLTAIHKFIRDAYEAYDIVSLGQLLT